MTSSRTRTLRLAPAALLCALAVAVVSPSPAAAADATFGEGRATATFGEGVEFAMPVEVTGSLIRAEVLLDLPDTLGPEIAEVPVPSPGSATLRFAWDMADAGYVVPNTTVSARWRLTPAVGEPLISPATQVRYADTRFDWRTLEGDVVRVHWYEGSDAFGREALEIGDEAVAETASLLGVTEDQPIDFFVYSDEVSFREALGPGTRENVGGQAHADIRTLFALITPGEINAPWVEIVIPHELVHLVFDTTVDNPYRFPPRWLNEGLAVYLSQGYDASDRARVEDAVRDGDLMPLTGLGGQFPTTFDRFALAYAESVSAVDHLVRRHGRDALVGLVRSYRTGLTDDEAFGQAIGEDVEAFQADWFEDLGADHPIRYGPQPAAAGPVPPGWEGAGATQPPATGGSEPPAPTPAAASASDASAGQPQATPMPASTVDDDAAAGLLPSLLALLAVAGAAITAVLALAGTGRTRP